MPGLKELPLWLRQILAGVGLFLLGGLIAFGYSYRPLHGAKNWQIEQLETRLNAVNRENLTLSDELSALRTAEAERVDPATLAQVEQELEKTRSALTRSEKQLERAEKKQRDANSSATRWRQRYEELRDAQDALAARPRPSSAPSTPPASASPGLPGAPASALIPGHSTTDTPPAPGASPNAPEGGMLGRDGSSPAALP
ncbi:MAG: hypothetical protein JRF61_18075 [Deltaproteobacteria bacterium]|jgi:hypothetical protein|nr:hypothetical protein [Deltaproteobacteria bacterium]